MKHSRAGSLPPPPSHRADHKRIDQEYTKPNRPSVRGKFLFVDGEKFLVKGISYGAFRPDAEGAEYHDVARLESDFAQMAAAGFNTVRIPHTMPPVHLLDVAQRCGLKVMVGLSAEQFVGYLIDRDKAAPDLEAMVRKKVRTVAGHPALLCYSIGNEIPAALARWIGRRRLEAYIQNLYRAIKDEDPHGLVTYVNYPTTEFLQLPFLDFVSFNVYLETEDVLCKYLARLQNIAGDRPLLMSEVGLDALRNGEAKQAEVLDWQIRTSFTSGCAGVVVFSWTDEWFRGGEEVDDWAFGVTDYERQPKPALNAVTRAFDGTLVPGRTESPRFSIVICTYNGARTIEQCLRGVQALRYDNYEVIVVNDGSTDGTAEMVSNFSSVRLITTENQGLSQARNVGLKASTGEFVAYLDDDAWPDPDWLHYLEHAFENSTHAGIGGPNIPPVDSGFIENCVANSPGGPVHVLLADDVAEHIPGCNMAFRREFLEQVGGFDPTFRVAGDDVDLCWRIQENGGTLGYHAAAMVWHRRRHTIRGYLKQQKGYGKAEALLEAKWPEKYNGFGHISWGGRVYGQGLTREFGRRWHVYHGSWGQAPFQGLVSSPPNYWLAMTSMPEWWLVILALAAISACGFLWTPFFFALPVCALALGVSLLRNVASLKWVRYADGRWGAWRRLQLQSLAFCLHFAQPLARLYGRLRYGLSAWRRRVPRREAAPRVRRTAEFTEEWIDPLERLRRIDSQLRTHNVSFRRGGDYDRWDFEVHGGFCGWARMLMAVEDHGSGTQYVRMKTWPTWRVPACLPILVLIGIAAAAVWQQAWTVAALFGVAGYLLLTRALNESASAQAAILDAVAAAKSGAGSTDPSVAVAETTTCNVGDMPAAVDLSVTASENGKPLKSAVIVKAPLQPATADLVDPQVSGLE